MGNASAFDLDALDTRIRELVAYARERDGEDRTLLFRNLVDLFLTGKAPKKQPTRDQLLDVIEALIPHVEPDGRRTVADLVANLAKPPLDLAFRLAKDRPHIVGDLLRATAFDENDIIELIARTGRDHHHVIASRSDLSANVWIALARAAPAAAPFDNQSTLALWRDDLGGENGDNTVTPFRTTQDDSIKEVAQAPAKIDTQLSSTKPKAKDRNEQGGPSEPKTTKIVDTRHAAELRILRTDKDLIADRIERGGEKMQTATQPALEMPQEKTQETAQKAPPSNEHEERSRPMVSVARGQGIWSWQSDRNGYILNVSDNGTQLYPRSQKLVGNSALELLGLGHKLGHPISRAFQRRSPIHDAPVALDNDDVKLRFWTLEATPIFSSETGIFEGYDGIMTPASAQAHPGLDLPDPKPVATPVTKTIIDENIDRTVVPPPGLAPSTRPHNQTALAKTSYVADDHPVDAPTTNQPLADIASEVLKDLIGNSVALAIGKNLRERQAELTKTKAEDDQSEADLMATFHILEETLANLIEAGKASGNTNVRLQTEIATACFNTLKDQLAGK